MLGRRIISDDILSLDLIDQLKIAIISIYPPAGFNPIYETIDGHPIENWIDDQGLFLFSWKEMINSFVGIKRQPPKTADPENASQKSPISLFFFAITNLVLNWAILPIFSILIFPVKMIMLILNTVKLVTELAPLSLAIYLQHEVHQIEALEDLTEKDTQLKLMALQFAQYFFQGLSFIGRAISSPGTSLAFSFKEGRQYGTVLDQYGNEDKTAGYILGASLAIISLSLSALFYIVKLPITFESVGYFAPKVLYLAGQISEPLAHGLSMGLNWAGSLFENAVSALTLDGLGAVAGSLVPVLDFAFSTFKYVANTFSEKPKVPELQNHVVSEYKKLLPKSASWSVMSNRLISAAPVVVQDAVREASPRLIRRSESESNISSLKDAPVFLRNNTRIVVPAQVDISLSIERKVTM